MLCLLPAVLMHLGGIQVALRVSAGFGVHMAVTQLC